MKLDGSKQRAIKDASFQEVENVKPACSRTWVQVSWIFFASSLVLNFLFLFVGRDNRAPVSILGNWIPSNGIPVCQPSLLLLFVMSRWVCLVVLLKHRQTCQTVPDQSFGLLTLRYCISWSSISQWWVPSSLTLIPLRWRRLQNKKYIFPVVASSQIIQLYRIYRYMIYFLVNRH